MNQFQLQLLGLTGASSSSATDADAHHGDVDGVNAMDEFLNDVCFFLDQWIEGGVNQRRYKWVKYYN